MEVITKLRDEDSVLATAKKIFNDFDVNQSCTIFGWIDEVEIAESTTGTTHKRVVKSKGREVLRELTRLDMLTNTRSAGNRVARKKVKPKDTIGGYLAHKIFRYKIVNSEGFEKVSIWRIQ